MAATQIPITSGGGFRTGNITLNSNGLVSRGSITVTTNNGSKQWTFGTNGNITLAPNGTINYANGQPYSSFGFSDVFTLKGRVDDYTALTNVSAPTNGDAWVVSSPSPSHLWIRTGTEWTDLGEFFGQPGENGQGVPVGGTAGQVLAKVDGDDFDTTWVTLSNVARTGSYVDLSNKPTIPAPYGVTSIDALMDVNITSATNGQLLRFNGTNWVNSNNVITPGGSNTQVQFNDQGALGSASSFTFNKTTGLLTATRFSGSGSNLTNIAGGNVVGAVANATYATSAGSATTAGTANSVSVANVSGIGNISTLNLTGSSSTVLYGNGVFAVVPSGGNAGGSNTQVQFNDAGSFGGNSSFTFNKASGTLNATLFAGSGANLTNIAGGNVVGAVGNATHANTAATANSVSVANVSGIGNISTLNLTGSSSTVLYGNGVFAQVPTTTSNGGGSYNQSLNTTDDVLFNSVGSIEGFVCLGTGTPTVEGDADLILKASHRVSIETGVLNIPTRLASEIANISLIAGDTYVRDEDGVLRAFVHGRECSVMLRVTAPNTSIGAYGDVPGLYATDNSYFYVCLNYYDGTTNIWKRISLPATTW